MFQDNSYPLTHFFLNLIKVNVVVKTSGARTGDTISVFLQNNSHSYKLKGNFFGESKQKELH